MTFTVYFPENLIMIMTAIVLFIAVKTLIELIP